MATKEEKRPAESCNGGRRALLRTGARSAAALVLSGLGRNAATAALSYNPDYGPLKPVRDQTTGLRLIALPEGFTYKSYAWAGDAMADGVPVPGRHDGMAVVGRRGNLVTLVRNHEIGGGTPFCNTVYDRYAGGGTTNLTFDVGRGRWIDCRASLSGTAINCAGGATPWGSWLSCEETTAGPGAAAGHFNGDGPVPADALTHGWVFEVPVFGRASARPLTAMGRFKHEAVAVDPGTGICYETEDQLSSGFYRFIPNHAGKLHRGGRLQMMKIAGRDNVDLSAGYSRETRWRTEWVDIAAPERAHEPGTENGLGVYAQGRDQGGARIRRGEGCWHDNGYIYVVSTNGGTTGMGQVFEYNPRKEQLRLVFESPSAETLNAPDNITVSPRGGILLCEDGSRARQMLHGLTREGHLFPFAENIISLNGERHGLEGEFANQEWCGATFHDQWLFVNIQTPGITFAITGPWGRGSL